MHQPAVALICNEPTPYRLNLHRRIVREIPQITFWSVFTHETANLSWAQTPCLEINPLFFGPGDSVRDQSKISRIRHEWAKGGRIIQWLHHARCSAVVVFGYNDAARLRIIYWCRRRRIPCFLFGDSNILCDNPSAWRAAAKRYLLPNLIRACTGIFYCGVLGQAYFACYGAKPARMFALPYEPDYNALVNVATDILEEIRIQFKLAPQRRRLIYSGRLAPEKRVDLLLAAFATVAACRPNWDLIIAGDGELRRSLERMVPSELRHRIIWTGFVGDHHRLACLYALSDALVLPSDYEPWGVVLTEAAVRLALVASSVVGAAADILKEGVNGRTFQAGNLSSLIAALIEVTDEARIDAFKAASPRVLAEWRSRSDPVVGLQNALRLVGLLPEVDNHGDTSTR